MTKVASATLSYELPSEGYQVAIAANGEEALETLRTAKFDLVICDISMPKIGGLEVLKAVKQIDPDIEVIMITAYGTIEVAVESIKEGAYDFIQKPFNLDEIFALVDKALQKKELKEIVAVYEASKAIFASIKLDPLLSIIVEYVLNILKADDASIMLMEDSGRLKVAASLGVQEDRCQQVRLALGEQVVGKVGQCKEPILISDSLENDSRFSDITALGDIKFALIHPFIIEGELLGILNANRTVHQEPFTSSDKRAATILASQIAQALYNAKLYRRLENKIQELDLAYQELKETQQQLIQAEKLAGIGELASGIAHELNNPLTGILGFARLFLQGDHLSPEQREDMEDILQLSQRCAHIIQDLLTFSRKTELKKEPTDLMPLLQTALKLAKYETSNLGLEPVLEYPDPLPSVFGDSNQLVQIFLNMIMNAVQAMKNNESGRLLIRPCHEGDQIKISFKDHGCGIPMNIQRKIFNPFFTTKPVGKGTGLGLSISYGIIQEHGGTIQVESRQGVGTTFTIGLPVCTSDSDESPRDTQH